MTTSPLRLGLPMATSPDLSQVERVRPLLYGRNCVVLGSAPLSTPYADVSNDEVIVAVNGGIGSLRRRPVDLFVVGSKQWDKPMQVDARPLHKQMLQQASHSTVRHALLLRGPKEATEHHTLSLLHTLRCSVESWSVLDKPTKLFIEQTLCARREAEPCSSGILAVAIALYCGAAVRMVGFSLSPGYHYISRKHPPTWWRNHVEADRRALVALRSAYGSLLSGELVEAVAA